MSNRYSQKWAVVAFFESKSVGLTFHRSEAPLHVTLAGVFAIETKERVERLLTGIAEGLKAFDVTGDRQQQWGRITVTVLKQSSDFDKLYRSTQSSLVEHGAVFNESEYLGDGFTPHVTCQKEGKMAPNQTWRILQIALIDMFPGSDYETRRVSRIWDLL